MRTCLAIAGVASTLFSLASAHAAARWGDLLCYDFVVEGRITRYANSREVECANDVIGCYASEVPIRADRVLAGKRAPDKFWATTIGSHMITPRSRLMLFVTQDDDGRYYLIDIQFADSNDFDVAGRPKLDQISRAVVCPTV